MILVVKEVDILRKRCYVMFFQHDRRCQVIEMNKMEESALEKKVSLRLGLLFQELVRSIIHRV